MRNKVISFILAIGALTTLSFSVRQAFAYDSSAAVDYAEQWWNGRNPNYNDYSESGGDCANFVSQCLIAGGLDLSIHPGADSYGSIPSCRDLHDYLVDSLGATWETRPKGQVEPLWFLPGDPAIFGYSDANPLTHDVFAVTGDATHHATCYAHSTNQYHRTIQWFFDQSALYDPNPFDCCTYYHIPTQTIPAPPNLLSPAPEKEPGPEINTLTPQLNWQESVGADYYALAISVYPYGTANIVYSRQQVYGSSHTVSNGVLESGNKYRWNIMAHNSAGWSDVSNTLYFQTPSLIHESGSLSMEIKRLKTLIFPRDSMLYVEPNTSELADFRALTISFINSEWDNALMQAKALGYELVDYYDTDTSLHYYLLREELNELEQQNLGWGSYIWNPYDQTDVLVEVPHPLHDIKTPEFAIVVFQGICGRALLMAGAHRAAMGDGIYGIANVAGREDCIFQIVHETWSEQMTLPIQIHGFDLDGHTDFPIGTDVVLSNGDGTIPKAHIDLDQAFDMAGLLSHVYNTLPVDDPINILVNGDIPGSTFSSLNAEYNVQGQYTRNTYNAPWIHCELEQSIRFNDPSKWQPAITAIVDTLSISRVKGIDVSSYQGDIDWSQVYNSGYRFAFARASWGDENPPTYVDAKFQQNMENGYNSGMLMGAYHFAYPDYGTDAESEARHFLNVAGTYITNGYLRPVLDLERGESLGWSALSSWIHEWMDTVNHETGVEPILYTYSDYASNLDASLSQYDLWIAHWTYDPNTPPNTGIWDSWVFWQYSDNGSVPGITGIVDLDLFNGDMPRLETFLIVAGPNDNPPVVDYFNVAPDSVTLGNSFTISYIVSDDIGLNRVELWRTVDENGDGEPDWPDDPEGYIDIRYLSGQTSYSDSFSDTPSVVDTYWYGLHVVDNAEQLSFEPDPPGPIQVTVTPGITNPPICVIELLERDRIDPIDEITVDHWFDIYVGDSTDDVGIREVRFSSDDSQDGIPQGTWTQWYDWEVSTGPYGWDSMNKKMAWSFATSGHKEVWTELKDSEGQTSQCCDNIHVPCVCTSWQDQGCGQGPCFETQMYQTRTCDSPGCAVEARCINHMSCEPGWKSPSASGRRYNDWTNPENAYSSNDQYAVANSWSSSQDWYNFGFDIPDGSIIEGIEIGIEGTGNGDDYVGKVKCWLYWRGFVLGETETDYIEFPATEDSLHILGGPSDLWGWDFWSPEDIVGEGFGVRLSTGLDWHTARIDSIQARIYYRVCPDISHDWLGLPCLVNSWLQQCNLGNDYCNCCDMNNDGIIDFADVAIFAQHWLEGL